MPLKSAFFLCLEPSLRGYSALSFKKHYLHATLKLHIQCTLVTLNKKEISVFLEYKTCSTKYF